MNSVSSLRTLALLLLAAVAAFAQSDSTSINGTVTDPSGAAIANAKVVAKNERTGAVREVATSSAGTFVIPAIPAGLYTVTVEVAGFKKYESKNNKIDPNLPATMDAVMQVGTTTETVEVTATVGAIQTETSTLGKLVEGKQISDLQLNGRNPLFLSLLKPGVRGGNSLANFDFGLTTGGLQINGSRTQDNLIAFDGAVGVRTRSNGTSIGTADLDAVQEVQILTANYSAEYGRSAGGQIRIVTKTGGQQFHGSMYEYLRNSATNANTWSRNRAGQPIAPDKFNQYGWNFNGPVTIPGLFNKERNKAFFFVSQEWVKRRTEATNVRTVPTVRMKQGDFGELLGSNIFFNTPQTIRDSNGTPYPGNVIPNAQTSKNGLALLSVYPNPNLAIPQGSGNWYGAAAAPVNQRKDTYSLDVLPTSRDQVKFRMNFYHYNDINPFQTNFLLSNRLIDRPNQTASLAWTRTINPTTVNEFLVTASRDQVSLRMADVPTLNRTTYGINYQYIFPNGKDLPNKLPTVDIAGFQTYTGSPYPSNSAGPIYNLSNNTTKIIGTHTIKFGVMLERAGQNDYDQINVSGVPGGSDNQNGRFVFINNRPGGSGTAISDAARGLFSTYAEIGIRSYTPYRGHMVEWFVQDSWKVTDKLKLEFGVRHSLIQPYYSLWGNMTVFDPKYYDAAKAIRVDRATGNPIPGTGDAYNGVVIPGSGWPDAAKGRVPISTTGEFDRLFRGEPKQYSNIQKNLFQPRVGLAYQIGSKTVVRSGIGRFSTRLGVSDSIFLGGNPPLQPIASIPNGNVDAPGGGSTASFPLSINTQDKIFKNPEAYNWNVTVERELGFKTVLELSYVGRKGLHAQRERNINQLLPGTIQANPGVNNNALRPFAGFGPIRITNNEASSFYQGFQLGVNRRFSSGFSYGFAYTYSKSSDNGSGQRDIIPNAFDASALWGPSDFDTRHVAVINFIYELPVFKNAKGLTRTFLGGWQVSGVTQFQSGTPGTVATGDDFAGVGTGSGSQLWQLNGGQITTSGKFTNAGDNGAYYIDVKPDANGRQTLYSQPKAGTFVTDRLRNVMYGPGFQNWNISAFKNFRVGERVNLQFRADGYNFVNHPNWGGSAGGGLDRNPNNATFGRVTAKGGERNMQFGLRFGF
ncbi:MAG: carboxypeptidase regulatory-like domain-containing protein [Acidobacteria bacterium]|nr:carboxypeptidase regulatory-like domain-containing protein [Acidobacteriota bacterium]